MPKILENLHNVARLIVRADVPKIQDVERLMAEASVPISRFVCHSLFLYLSAKIFSSRRVDVFMMIKVPFLRVYKHVYYQRLENINLAKLDNFFLLMFRAI